MSKRKGKGVRNDNNSKSKDQRENSFSSGAAPATAKSSGEATGGSNSGNETTKDGSNQGEGGNSKSRKVGKNDPIFYANNPALLLATASIPWNIPLGSKFNYAPNDYAYVDGGGTTYHYRSPSRKVPGVMSLGLVPSIGESESSTSPVNIAANSIYSKIREKVSGRKNYDPSDYIKYLLSIMELDSFIQWMKRLYKCAKLYSDSNWYFGKPLVEANGFDINDLVLNLANFRAYIDTFIEQIRPWAIPRDIMLSHRKHMLYETVYFEGPSIKEQMYQFVPIGFYKFTYYTKQDGTVYGVLSTDCSLFVDSNGDFRTGLTYANLVTYAQGLISNITGDEDFGIMSGDTRRVFEGAIWEYTGISSEDTLEFSQDPLVLLQMKNADIMPWKNFWNQMETTYPAEGGSGTGSTIFWNSVQEDITTGNLINSYNLYGTSSGLYNASSLNWLADSKKFVTFPGNQCLATDVAEITRLQWTTTHPLVAGPRKFCSGSEICVVLKVNGIPNFYDSNGTLQEFGIEIPMLATSPMIYNVPENIAFMAACLAFRFAPKLYLAQALGTHDYAIEPIWQLDNYTVYSVDTLERLHSCCLMSLFAVPGTNNVM